MAAAAMRTLSTNQTREGFRAEHKVRLVSTQEEGRGFERLPGSVYGFTYAPATETPLFSKSGYGAYEVHKLADGSGRLIVYCTREVAGVLADGPEMAQVDVYPEAYGDATMAVALPMEWITSSVHKVVRREGNPVTLKLSAL